MKVKEKIYKGWGLYNKKTKKLISGISRNKKDIILLLESLEGKKYKPNNNNIVIPIQVYITIMNSQENL